jgi:hypothetical protein
MALKLRTGREVHLAGLRKSVHNNCITSHASVSWKNTTRRSYSRTTSVYRHLSHLLVNKEIKLIINYFQKIEILIGKRGFLRKLFFGALFYHQVLFV